MTNFILPTIGPITENKKNIAKILKFTSVIRLNGSHNTIQWHKKISKIVKSISSEATILLDLPGIKPRTSNNENISIKKNQIVTFGNEFGVKNIPLTRDLPKISKKIKFFSLSDGRYKFKIISFGKNYITGKSNEGFVLEKNKGLNLPNCIYDNKLQLKVYNQFLFKAKNLQFDAIGLSYIQNSYILKKIKEKFPKYILISKIENIEGLKNLDEICKFTDGIMIDRGDLSAEIYDENLFNAVIKISDTTKKYGIPLIIATENLDSMNERFSPTKSEIMSLGFNHFINADKIMLSDETTTSRNWYNTVKWLDNYLKKQFNLNTIKNITNSTQKKLNSLEILWQTIKFVDQTRIIIFSKKGYAIKKLKQINPNVNILVFTDNPKTKKHSNFWNNVNCKIVKKFDNSKGSKFIYNTIKKYKKEVFDIKNEVIVLYINNPRPGSRVNTLSIIHKKDFI